MRAEQDPADRHLAAVPEFYLNDAAIAALGVTENPRAGKGEWSAQVDFANGHFWEGRPEFHHGPDAGGAGDAAAARLQAEADGGLPARQWG